MRKHSPFKPGPGLRPPYLAGRDIEQGQLKTALDIISDGEMTPSIVMYGPRGTGKTVLLDWLQRECEKAGVDVIEGTPASDLKTVGHLPGFLLPPGWVPEEVAVDFKVVSATWTRPNSDTRCNLADHLVAACRRRPRVVLLDEAHTLEPDVCKHLLNTSQTVYRKAPFLLVLAGTPGLRPHLMSVGATFVERSEMIGVGRLNEQAASDAISVPLQEDGIAIEDAALQRIVENAQCYPFFLQQWGRALWNLAAEHKLTLLNDAQVDQLMPKIDTLRVDFYEARYDTFSRNKPLLGAAVAVGKAFMERDSLEEDEVLQAIEQGLPDSNNRTDQADQLSQELNRMDYVWKRPGSIRFEPGIPSFMTFVQSRAKNRELLNASSPATSSHSHPGESAQPRTRE